MATLNAGAEAKPKCYADHVLLLFYFSCRVYFWPLITYLHLLLDLQKEELEKKTLEIEEKDAEICSLKHMINSLQHGSPNVSGEHFPGDVSLPFNQEPSFLEDSMSERVSPVCAWVASRSLPLSPLLLLLLCVSLCFYSVDFYPFIDFYFSLLFLGFLQNRSFGGWKYLCSKLTDPFCLLILTWLRTHL